MRIPTRQLVLLFALLASLAAGAGCDVETPPQQRAEACNRLLARSINLGNMLEFEREGMYGPVLVAEFFDQIKTAGFSAVRLPIRWDARAGREAPYPIEPDFLARVDWAVAQAQRVGLAIILDTHHFTAMMSEPETELPRFLGIWQQVATHYRHAPPQVLFELLNEPMGKLDDTRWNAAIAALIPLIRQSNPDRTLIVGGTDWNGYRKLATLRLPETDRNLIASFHYYEPMEVSHQGANWVAGADAWLGTSWSARPAEMARLNGAFSQVTQWAEQNRRPVFLGEFGVYSKAGLATRVAWTTAVARAAEQRGFSWSYWEFGAGFGAYDPSTQSWRQPLLRALIPQ
ncbi:glycoside hydrolase family 5 protein [Chitinimonas naiadis]